MTDVAERLAKAGLAVKPLEWRMTLTYSGSNATAETADPDPCIRYQPVFLALGSGDTYREVWGCFVSPPFVDGSLVFHNGVCEFQTVDAAKAAAQADYDARILATLVAP